MHDWLDSWRGGENTLAEICRLYPEADLYSLVDFLSEEDRRKLLGKRPYTSFLQRLPLARNYFRALLPLFPRAIESFDLRRYDVVLSSSHAVAKGVRTRPGQLHVCYCYTPMRYAWDMRSDYLKQTGLDTGIRGAVAMRVLDFVQTWDAATSDRVTEFVAISRHIADRIRRCYQRTSTVIYPPVDTGATTQCARSAVYVTVSHLVPYKRVDLLVSAFAAMPERQLVVIGDGPQRATIESAAPPNVRFVGRVADDVRNTWLARARAFVFAAEEDFGIAPLEAQAHGTPVIALARGGSMETIRGLDDGEPSGVLFPEQTASAIAQAVHTFEQHHARITAEACRVNAARFAAPRFRDEFSRMVQQRWEAHAKRL